MLASHKRILDARDLAEALRAGEGRSPAICDTAAIETACRRRVLEKASLLLIRGVEYGGVYERLGLADSQVGTLPEARARMAESELQRTADRKVRRTAAKLKFGDQRASGRLPTKSSTACSRSRTIRVLIDVSLSTIYSVNYANNLDTNRRLITR